MARKTSWFLLQAMTVICLVLFVGVGSAFAWKVTVYNWGGKSTGHVRVHVQKLFSQPEYCTFDIAPGQEATCDTHGWCPSSVYATLAPSRDSNWNEVGLYLNCLGGINFNTTCCWDVKFAIVQNIGGAFDMILVK